MKKSIIINILLAAISLFATAQKLPKVQEASLRAPGNVKIDGKATEWNDGFQAYNVSNHIYYTVANDDKKLFLTIHTDGALGSEKVLRGGITFSIAASSKKAAAISVTYPAIRKRSSPGIERLKDSPYVYRILGEDTIANKVKIDSLISLSNRQINSLFEDILVTGIKEITDPIISIYNAQGIQVSSSFNNKMEFTYELAIPLKHLGDAINSGQVLKYNIKLNTLPTIAVAGAFDPPLLNITPEMKPDDLYRNYTTDFWGEYTLAKK